MLNVFLTVMIVTLASGTAFVLYCRWRYPEPHLNWSEVDVESISFPPDFLWGAATAAHQVEGGLHNNWSVFEESRGLEKSGEACDHWNRWKEDFEMLSELGLTTYRFSIEWSRLEPEPGKWDSAPLQVYSDMVDDLLNRGIRPVVTLHHFSHPAWWEDRGGFSKKENLPEFIAYCERVFETLSDRVDVWCTINEPTVFSSMGYTLGQFPPGHRSIRQTLRIMRNLMRAHAALYASLKSRRPDASIGVAKNVTLFDPLNRWSPIDWAVARLLDWLWSGAWQRGILSGRMLGSRVRGSKNSLDFIGLNYYTHFLTGLFMPTTGELAFARRENEVSTEFGYPMYAEGFRRAIEKVSVLNVPIEITENGVADSNDVLRPEHLMRHLWVLSEAISDGYDIKSFHHWSLMDNFEWAEGYSMRFGLYEVDFDTQERNLRKSGELYRKIITEHMKT